MKDNTPSLVGFEPSNMAYFKATKRRCCHRKIIQKSDWIVPNNPIVMQSLSCEITESKYVMGKTFILY